MAENEPNDEALKNLGKRIREGFKVAYPPSEKARNAVRSEIQRLRKEKREASQQKQTSKQTKSSQESKSKGQSHSH